MSPTSGTRPNLRSLIGHRARRLAASAGGMAVGLALLALPAPASADPDGTATAIPDALSTLWDDPTDSLNLAWDGSVYGRAVGSFIGEPTVVPGDQVWRTMNVTNAGPGDGILTVRIINTVTDDPTGDVNTDLEDISIIHWDVDGTRGQKSFKDIRLDAPLTTLAGVPVTQGETVPVTIGYEFPFDATGGRNQGQPSQILSFDVEFILHGDADPGRSNPTPTTATPTDTDTGTGQPAGTGSPTGEPTDAATDTDSGTGQPDGSASGTGTGTGKPGVGGRPGGALAYTGVAIGGTLLAAGLSITIGLLLSRRRHQETPQPPTPRHTA